MLRARKLVLLLLLAPSTARADDLGDLMKQLSAMPGLEAKFREKKEIALLQAPLVTEGVLRFSPPASLVRETTKPQSSRVLIIGDRLYFDDGEHRQEVDVGNNPVVRSFVNSFVLLLAGDRSGLEEIFEMRFAPASEEELWKLELLPKKAPIDKVIRKMVVRGRGVKLDRLIVQEANGDRTETTFVEVDTKRRFSESEQKKLFRVP